MTNFIDIAEVYEIHERILRRAKTKGGVRDFALLHSAVERPKATYSGRSLYPSIFSKAAALLQSICLNHPFTDGNKRTAWATCHRLLWVNGWHLRVLRKEAVGFMIRVDNQKPDALVISNWLRVHSKKIS